MSSKRVKTPTTEERLRRAMKSGIAGARQFALMRTDDMLELEPIRRAFSEAYAKARAALEERERARKAVAP